MPHFEFSVISSVILLSTVFMLMQYFLDFLITHQVSAGVLVAPFASEGSPRSSNKILDRLVFRKCIKGSWDGIPKG